MPSRVDCISEFGGTDDTALAPPTLAVVAAGAAVGNNTDRLRATDLASHANLLRPVPTDITARIAYRQRQKYNDGATCGPFVIFIHV